MLGANFTVESIMTDLCREIISVSSLVLDLNNHFIEAMFIERSSIDVCLRQEGPVYRTIEHRRLPS